MFIIDEIENATLKFSLKRRGELNSPSKETPEDTGNLKTGGTRVDSGNKIEMGYLEQEKQKKIMGRVRHR